MPKIEYLQRGLNVAGIYWHIQSNPHLWNQYTDRTAPADSPHHGLDDIWVRFVPHEAIKDGPQDCRWYLDIPGVRQLCADIMHSVQGTELGGVLITRVPAGAEVKPHTDPGWHARRYEKYAIQLTSAPGQRFCFENDEYLETQPGDVFWFNNEFLHWVTNPTQYERVTMIVCVRREK